MKLFLPLSFLRLRFSGIGFVDAGALEWFGAGGERHSSSDCFGRGVHILRLSVRIEIERYYALKGIYVRSDGSVSVSI